MGQVHNRFVFTMFCITLFWNAQIQLLASVKEHDLVPQKIHEHALNDMAFEPSRGLTFASLSYGCVILWEVNTRKQIRVFPGMGKGFTCLAFTPDGKYLAAGAKDASIVFWSTTTGKVEKVLRGHTLGVLDMDFSPDGKTLVSVASSWGPKQDGSDPSENDGEGKVTSNQQKVVDGTLDLLEINMVKRSEVKFWDVATGAFIREIPASYGAIEPVDFAPDGLSIVTGAIDFTAGRWDVQTGQLMAKFNSRNQRLQAVAFSPDGTQLAGAIWGKDSNQNPARGLLLWDLKSQKVRHNFQNYTGFVENLVFSPNGQFLASVANDFNAFLPDKWRPRSKVIPLRDETSFTGQLEPFEKFRWRRNRMRARLTNGRFQTKSHSEAKENLGEINLWRVADGKSIHRFRDSSPIYTVDFSPDGKHLIADSYGRTLLLRRTKDFEPIDIFQGLAANILDVVFSPNGRYVGNLDGSPNARVWDVGNIRGVRLLRGHRDRVNAIAFSMDSQTVATASKDKTIKLWDVSTGELKHTFPLEKEPRALAFSPDGKHLVSLDWPLLFRRTVFDKKISWFDLTTKKPVTFADKNRWNIGGEKYNRIRFSADGRTLMLSAGYRQLGYFEFASQAPTDVKEVATGETIYRYGTSDAADYSSSGRYVVTAQGVTITLWESKHHTRLQQFVGHQFTSALRSSFKQALGVTSVALSPDEKYLVSCGTDRTMRFWDVKSGKQLRQLDGPYQLARFSPNGSAILSAQYDGRFQIWSTAKLASSVPASEALTVSLIGLADTEEFIAFTSDLSYKSTPNGYRAVVVLKNGKAYGFDQFDMLLNRPDRVVAALPNPNPELIRLYEAAYQKRLRSYNLKEQDLTLDFDIPEVEIKNDPAMRKVTTETFILDVVAQDNNTQLDRLTVWVNGVPIEGMNGMDLKPKKATKIQEKKTIPLGWGENHIEVSARNSRGAESYRKSLHIHREGPAPKPDLYVLSIGVSKYSYGNGEKNLLFAAKDATDFVAGIKNLDAYFGEIKHVLLRDEQVTKAQIMEQRKFLQQARVDDVILVLMAGHGILDANQTFYFGTADVDFNHPNQRGFAFHEIEALLDQLTCRQKLAFIDACFSGPIDPDFRAPESAVRQEPTHLPTGAGGPSANSNDSQTRGFGTETRLQNQENPAYQNIFDLMRDTFVDLTRGSGAYVIAAAQGNEYAYETKNLQNGMFTHVLLQGLQLKKKPATVEADLNEDGALSITELRDYVTTRVKDLSNGKQTPTSRMETLNYDFDILSPPEKKLSWRDRVLAFGKKQWNHFLRNVSGELWVDQAKPPQYKGEELRRASGSELIIGKPRSPARGYYPLPPDEFTEKQSRRLKPRSAAKLPFAFQSQFAGRRAKAKEQASYVFHFLRRDQRKGELYLTQKQGKKAMSALLEDTLAFEFSNYAPVHLKKFISRGRNEVVSKVNATFQGRDVLFLATRTTYDAGEGQLYRLNYHMLYCGPNYSLRLTTAGGHEADKNDVNSYQHDPEFEAAVKTLFQRFQFQNN